MRPDTFIAAAHSTTPPLWRVLTSLGYFTALAATIGFVFTYLFAVRPVLRGNVSEADDARVLRRRCALLLSTAGALLLVAGYFQLASLTARATTGLSYADALAPSQVLAFLATPAQPGAWISKGALTALQNGFELLAALLLVPLCTAWGRRHLDRLVLAAAPVVVLVSTVRSLPTDFGAETLDDAVGAILVQAHIVGGTLWLGGLAMLALLARTRNALGARAGLPWALVWQRFGGVALCAVGAVLVSGLWLAWKEFGTVGQLFTTTYGRVLLIKLAFVATMISAGGVNQLWLMPRIARRRAAGDLRSVWALTLRHFPAVVAVEAVLGVGVLVVVPFLTGSPRTQAGDAEPDHVATPGILAIGALLALMLALSFFATVKASEALARRDRLPA